MDPVVTETENLVLRTVYLPHSVDQRLKALAFRQSVSKNQLIRDMVQEGLDRRAANGLVAFADQPLPAAPRPRRAAASAPRLAAAAAQGD